MIKNFSDLLKFANEQEEAQRLLFLFVKANTSKKSRKRDEKSGTLDAVMCVDKLPEETSSFKSLVEEADSISREWDLVFIAGLSGEAGQAPTTEDAEPYLNQMTNDLVNGQNIERYLVFDRNEHPIVLQVGQYKEFS